MRQKQNSMISRKDCSLSRPYACSLGGKILLTREYRQYPRHALKEHCRLFQKWPCCSSATAVRDEKSCPSSDGATTVERTALGAVWWMINHLLARPLNELKTKSNPKPSIENTGGSGVILINVGSFRPVFAKIEPTPPGVNCSIVLLPLLTA